MNKDIRELFQQGLNYLAKKDWSSAEKAYHRVLQRQPNNLQASYLLGRILFEQKQYSQALDLVRRLLQSHPDDKQLQELFLNALFKTGQLLYRHKKYAEAKIAFKHYLNYQPEAVNVLVAISLVLDKSNDHQAALEYLNRAEKIDEKNYEVFLAKGILLSHDGQYLQALAYYDRALALKKNDAVVHSFKSMILLALGRYLEGWREWEWRLKRTMFKKMKSRLPAWRGQRIKGKTIYVQREQGLGDAIQFIRYLDMLKDQKVRIVLECPNQLFRLLKDSPIIDQLVRERKKRINNPPVKCDYAVFLLSLPGIFKTELNTIPKQLPYLVADPTLIKKWQAKLSKDSRLKIGIVWGGNPRHSNDFNRSCSLELFLKYLSHPQVALYSLQKGIYAEQLATVKLGEVIDLGKKVTDLADTAAIIMNLDLVISVDTAVAHLAGALAQPVWVLLPYVPDWRWLLDRSDSPWYPTMRLFRQSAKMDWAEVLKSIKGELVKRFF